ncbi:glycosyltransferase involved in cell wall biosynthesis [Lewinella marina]|nr:glycosyltransferase [Neolewinella marina]NJB86244.1 glycosyltransferase involved in cell wall biosynthesis [Neolewinella marina]
MMKIAVLAPLAFPVREPFAGGLEKHTAELAAGLAQRGHAVTLLARPGSVAGEGVSLRPVTGGYRQALGELRRGDFDLVQNNSLHFLPLLLGAWLKVPLVTTLHTPPFRGLRLAARLSRRRSTVSFVAISEYIRNAWRPYAGESEVIYNGVSSAHWPFSARGEPQRAVWAGRISPEKGPELAIAAAERAGYALDLAGPVYDQSYFDREIAPRLNDRICYHGALTGQALARLMGRAAVGLFTSVWEEPFGLVIPEMLACGTPVAGFRSGAAPELINERVGQLVEKGNVPALVAALPRVAGLDRHACRAHAERYFRLEAMILAYEGYYRRILMNV